MTRMQDFLIHTNKKDYIADIGELRGKYLARVACQDNDWVYSPFSEGKANIDEAFKELIECIEKNSKEKVEKVVNSAGDELIAVATQESILGRGVKISKR